MNRLPPKRIDYRIPASPRRSIADVPQRELTYRTIKLYIVGALVWDYALTVLDIAAQMRITPVKKLSRAVREIHKDYERIRSLDLDEKHIRQEWQLAETFEAINRDNFKQLCAGLVSEIRSGTSLNKEYEMLVEAVQMAMTVLDALKMFAGECDAFIRKYYPEAPHSILPDHFSRLAVLLPEYAGDCYDRHSRARKLAAESLLNEINKMEFYGDD